MQHSLKIKQQYLIHILEGIKTFEIRNNDRDYQVGDTISFLPVESDQGYDAYAVSSPLPIFNIDYVHHGFGVQDGFAILGISPIVK